ncbi:MAG: hypothetical protein QXH12_05755 [Candidatus Caldarchaeum sp.]
MTEGTKTSAQENQYMKDKFIGIMMETLTETFEALRLKDYQRRTYIDEIQMIIEGMKNL